MCTPEEQEMLENAEKVMREIIENLDLDLLDHSGAYTVLYLYQYSDSARTRTPDSGRFLYSSRPSCL